MTGEVLNEKYTNLFNKLVKYLTPEDIEKLYKGDYSLFDLNDFVNNPDKQEFFKHWYKYKSEFVNILDVISYVPHFAEMLKAFTLNNSVLDELTVRRKEILDISSELKYLGIIKGGLTPRIYNNINRFLNECVANQYLNNIEPFNIQDVNTVYVNGSAVDNSLDTYTVDLSTLDGRLTFKYWMDEKLSNLPNSDAFSKNIVIKNFQNELRIPYTMCVLDIDMSTMSRDINESRLSDIVIAYNNNYA